ncbi:hypothetical protein [Owenweeksia hongkongensis]|uniref:hypothetical protein n=1 Tax=Owenweeksia hongkongensis TaxID=253245 RepID=UPI003A8DB7B1
MKKTIGVLMLVLIAFTGYSQDFEALPDMEFETKEDYKNHEAEVQECANYILNQNVVDNELNRLTCTAFMMDWMEGTPDYTFSIGSEFMDYCKGQIALQNVYMASLVKVALDGEPGADPQQISDNAREIFLDYCADENNKVKKNRAIKKALKAREEANNAE